MASNTIFPFESVQEREARFAVLDRIKQKLPDVPPEELERDVQAAIRAIRGRRKNKKNKNRF